MPDLEADTVSALEAPEFAPAQFVRWFREVAPYVHAFRGKTFVVAFGGELVQAGALNTLVQDLSLLSALGIHLVLVHGSRPQVNEQLRLKGYTQQFGRGMEPTDAAALECAKEAAGEIRLDIEAAFSQGLPNTPMSNSHVRVISGNFVTARPAGVLDGVDYKHTGHVRKIDVDALKFAIESGSIVLLSPLGFSPTGEAFNLAMEDLATSVAVALRAE
ncbi:amino-acid N-acetyltransferase, partial [Bordetella hinzii]|nr:amino-acid N-acetyltransferase [Bordetella hinzii]